MTGYGNIEPLQTQPDVTHSLEQMIDQGNPIWKWAVEQCSITDNGARIALQIQWGTAIEVSDGLYKHEFGTSALQLDGNERTTGKVLVNITPGHPSEQSS
jgi:hypothetical protein